MQVLDHLVVTAKHDFYSGQQFHNFKWLDNIILCAHFQTADTVIHRIDSGEKNNRNPQRSDIIHQFKSVGTGQHDIQQDQIKYLPV